MTIEPEHETRRPHRRRSSVDDVVQPAPALVRKCPRTARLPQWIPRPACHTRRCLGSFVRVAPALRRFVSAGLHVASRQAFLPENPASVADATVVVFHLLTM